MQTSQATLKEPGNKPSIMLSIESLLLSTFNFCVKFVRTIVDVLFRTGSLFKDLIVENTDKYIDARVYFSLSVFLGFARVSSRGKGTTDVEKLDFFSSEVIGQHNLIYAAGTAILIYGFLHILSVLFRLSPKYTNVFMNYNLYWLGTHLNGRLIIATALSPISWTGLHYEYEILLSVPPLVFLIFSIRKQLVGIRSLDKFSQNWKKFAAMAFVLPVIIIVAGESISAFYKTREGKGLAIVDNIGEYNLSEAKDSARADFKVRLVNTSNEMIYLENEFKIHVKNGYDDLFDKTVEVEGFSDLIEIKPNQIATVSFRSDIGKTACQYMKRSTVRYLEIDATGYKNPGVYSNDFFLRCEIFTESSPWENVPDHEIQAE